MLELIKSDYNKVMIPAHFDAYNISDKHINGLKPLKLLQLPKLHLMKYDKGKITQQELKEIYFKSLDSRGQHLISIDYGSCAVMVCNCDTYDHNDRCPMPYLKEYMALKNHEIEKYI